MITDEEIDLIEAYHQGELSGDALSAFETKLVSDAEFAKEVNAYKFIMAGIKSRGERDFVEKLASWEMHGHEQKVKKPTLSLQQILAIAASILIFIVPISIWISNTYSNDNPNDLFTEYFQPYEDIVSNRSSATDIKLSGGMAAYNKANYASAISAFEMVNEESPQHESAVFYLGISYLANNNLQKAENIFISLSQGNESPFREQSRWYLVLTYLKEQKIKEANVQLNEIIVNPGHPFVEEAKLLFEDLNKK